LDPEKNGSEFYGGSPQSLVSGAGSDCSIEPESGRWSERVFASKGGKLEKSALSFIMSYRAAWLVSEESSGHEEQVGLPSDSEAGGRQLNTVPVFRPSLGEEMRRSFHRFTDVHMQSARTLPTNSKAIPLLQWSAAAGPEEVPMQDFVRAPSVAMESSQPDVGSGDPPEIQSECIFTRMDVNQMPLQDSDSAYGECAASGSGNEAVAMATLSGSSKAQGGLQTFSLSRGVNSPSESITQEAGAHEFQESMVDAFVWKTWGYPPSALRLLYNLEEFRQQQVSNPPHSDVYANLPEELFHTERITSTVDGSPYPARGWPEDDESLTSHYFWLEVFFEHHSGRHPTLIPTTEGGWTSFEPSDMAMSASAPGRTMGSGCGMQ
jgi:hypothetical protein